jgi:hypothetical protein
MLRLGTLATIAGSAACWLGVCAGPATAASETVDCAQLQGALTQAQTGDTITLDQLCTKSNSGASDGAFILGSGASQASYTLAGKPGTGAGFDGTGVSSSLLSANGSTSLATSTIRNLTFKNGSSGTIFGGGAIDLSGDPGLLLDHDTFTDNRVSTGEEGGAVAVETNAASGSVTIENSTFQGNSSAFRGGAVSIVILGGPSVHVNITHDTFTGNSVASTSSAEPLRGGALSIEENEPGTTPIVTQAHNRFSGNSVTGPDVDVYGGAESSVGVEVHSTDDIFTGNSLPAPAGAHFSEGSALSLANTSCTPPTTPHHVATNLVIADNSIADGGQHPANAWGALYIGCSRQSPSSNTLKLINATISGNRGGGGTAGIWGDDIDQLTVQNSVVTGNSDGVNLTGFNGSGGLVTATHSDICQGAAPFAGPGNICQSPKLVNASAGNVHETYSSPTIDRGSDALVPSGVTTDVFGRQRISPKLAGGPPVVDMGAAEFGPIAPPQVTIARPASQATYVRGQKVHSAFTCKDAAGGPGIASCRDSAGRPSGALIDTSTAGLHFFKVVAVSRDGLKAASGVTYTVKKG